MAKPETKPTRIQLGFKHLTATRQNKQHDKTIQAEESQATSILALAQRFSKYVV